MIWIALLYFFGVTIPLAMLISLVLNPSWGSALWFVGLLLLGAGMIGGARERQRRRKPAHEQ
jgi:hypothetical protein